MDKQTPAYIAYSEMQFLRKFPEVKDEPRIWIRSVNCLVVNLLRHVVACEFEIHSSVVYSLDSYKLLLLLCSRYPVVLNWEREINILNQYNTASTTALSTVPAMDESVMEDCTATLNKVLNWFFAETKLSTVRRLHHLCLCVEPAYSDITRKAIREELGFEEYILEQ